MNKLVIISVAVLGLTTVSHLALGQGAASASALHFSAQPDESEIFSARVFDEPLVPMGGHPLAAESAALADALSNYSNRTNADDFSGLSSFLTSFPDSAWSPSLLLHLGTEYYNTGHYSKALESWEQAWQQSKNIMDGPGKPQADRALGELARMYSKLGRFDQLSALLDATKNRPLEGPATQLIHSAHEAHWFMQNRPAVSFRCGPLALDAILAARDPKLAGNRLIAQSKSTTNGIALPQVAALSAQLGLNYQMAFRSTGAPFIVPSVIHWKVGHYAALLAKSGDRYLVKDLTFHSRLMMTTTALDQEASGYFLVPPGALPRGWRVVSESEAQAISGKGVAYGRDPNHTGGGRSCGGGGGNVGGGGGNGAGAGGGPGCSGMTTYTMNTMLASLTLYDMPVGYSPPLGPVVYFIATYNQLEANQPATFYYSNLGQKWDFNWLSYVTDNPYSPGAEVSLYQSGGGTIFYAGYYAGTQSYALEQMTQTILVKTSSSSYEQQFQDGSKREFALSDGSGGTSRRIFMTQIIDPAGNAVQLQYDTSLRITNIVDAIGQSTTFSYGDATYPYAITQVTDPFGRSASLQYNPQGLLSQITDVLGLTSQYTYGSNQFVAALETPYGTTTFTNITGNEFITCLQATDPLGESELLESNPSDFPDQLTGQTYSSSETVAPNHWLGDSLDLNLQNSFFWDKRAFRDGARAFTNATIYQFCDDNFSSEVSGVVASVKKPLENRVWYRYSGETTQVLASDEGFVPIITAQCIIQPSAVARVLDDGTTQLRLFQYNALGRVTNATDPAGRNFTYVYATNNVDLLAVQMTSNGKNELLGSMTYSSQHRPLTITDASGQTSTNTYNAHGQILATTDPLGETTTFFYSTNGYLLSITGPLQTTNDVTSFTYDPLGRVQTVTDTDGYTLAYAYDAMDRITSITHPDGTYEQFVYNLLDLAATRDRLGRWATFTYNADRQLISTQDPLGRVTGYEWCNCGSLTGLIDPLGRETTWDYDLESRPIAKHYVDGSTISYQYENTTSRPYSRLDEQGQETTYQYNVDDTLASVSYPNAIVPTPTVAYTYDTNYNRIVTMQDGVGTTVYTYNPITTISEPGAGRLASVSGPLPNSMVTYRYDQLGRVINRAINGVGQTLTFDVLGRPTTVTNALGAFQYTYVDATSRPASDSYPNGQTNLYTYYNNLGDDRLLQIQHLYPNGSLLSAFGYAYNAIGQITAWTNQWDNLPTRVWLPTYDAADQLTNVASTGGPSTATNYAYAYDPAGNRTLAQTNAAPNQFNYNALNQLVGATPSLGKSATYEWDAENRLTAINQGLNRSQFSYDGLGRRVKIMEITNGVATTNNYFLWCGEQICELRDTTGTNVVTRMYPQGEALPGSVASTNYYYTKDHLGSIRELADSTVAIRARYDYDPYGAAGQISGNSSSDLRFTGFYYHTPSGMNLAQYRGYGASLGRWIGRDPLKEMGGLNLYAYVMNDPINRRDVLGLCDESSYESWRLIEEAWQQSNGNYEDAYDSIKGRQNGNNSDLNLRNAEHFFAAARGHPIFWVPATLAYSGLKGLLTGFEFLQLGSGLEPNALQWLRTEPDSPVSPPSALELTFGIAGSFASTYLPPPGASQNPGLAGSGGGGGGGSTGSYNNTWHAPANGVVGGGSCSGQ